MKDDFNEIEDCSKKLKILLNKAQGCDLIQGEMNLSDLRIILSDMRKKLDTIDNEISYLDKGDQPSAKQRFRTIQSDYEMHKSQINKIEEDLTRKRNSAKFTSGELHGFEAKKVERDMIVDLHKQTDYQGDIIHEIRRDLVETNDNLKEAGIVVIDQGKQINRIHGNVNDAQATVLRTDKNINQMNRRNRCTKILLHILCILLFLTDASFLTYKLIQKFKK